MLKNMFKRSWLSVRRKPSRSLVLMLVLFVMANLVLAAITIKSATTSSTEYAKRSLGGEVKLNPDMEKIRKNFSQMSNNSIPEINDARKSTAEKISKNDKVKSYSYGVQTMANLTDGLKAIEESNGMPSAMLGGSSDPIAMVSGANSYSYLDAVKNKSINITDGKKFNANNEALISYDFAKKNNLKIGDKFKISNSTTTKKQVELMIVGIYENTSTKSSKNTIYTNADTAAELLEKEQYHNGDYSVSDVVYYMKDPENADKFVEETKKNIPEVNDLDVILGIDDALYKQMVGPIEQVGASANMIFWIVIIASILIICLIIFTNVKDRRYEIGVLVSLGAKKVNVFGQIVTELLIIGTIGFMLSIATSGILANQIGKSMLSNQIDSSKNSPNGQPAGEGGMIMMAGDGGPSSDRTVNENTIKEIDVSSNLTDYVLVFSIGYAIILVSVIAGSATILKLKPKTILSGKE